MNLQEMLKDVKRYGDSILIAELQNGYALGYEKKQRGEKEVVSGVVIPADDSHLYDFSGRTLRGSRRPKPQSIGEQDDFEKDYFERFTEDALAAFEGYHSQHPGSISTLEAELQQLYQQAVQPLELKECPLRPSLKDLALPLALTTGFPLLAPATLLYFAKAKPQGEGALGLFFLGVGGPYMLAQYCEEMVSPSLKYLRVKNRGALMEKREGNVAVDFIGTPQECFGVGLYFPDGNGLEDCCNSDTYFNSKNWIKKVRINDGAYEQAEHFMNLPEKLHQELREKMKARKRELEKWNEFQKSMTAEDQFALLKHLKFIGG